MPILAGAVKANGDVATLPPAPAPPPLPPKPAPAPVPAPPPDALIPPGEINPAIPPGIVAIPAPPAVPTTPAPPSTGGAGTTPGGEQPPASGDDDPFGTVDVGQPGAQAVLTVARWIKQTLDAIGAPTNKTTSAALQDWADSEGVAAYANNPLAAEDVYPGSTPYPPSILVQVYPSLAALVAVYKRKLTSSTYNAIQNALVQGDDLEAIWTAINESPWCAGCQGGKYPTVLYNAVFGKVAPKAPTTPVQPGDANDPSGGVVTAWKGIVTFWSRKVPAASSTMKANADELLQVVKS